MLYFNENVGNSSADELFHKMITVLRQRGFYADDNKDHDPCHFLTEQEQTVYQSAIEYYNAIPF